MVAIGPTYSKAHQQQSKITKLVLITEKQLKAMNIIKDMPLRLRYYSFLLSFTVYLIGKAFVVEK